MCCGEEGKNAAECRGRTHKSEQENCACFGGQGHLSANCTFRQAACYRCHRKGHLAKMRQEEHPGQWLTAMSVLRTATPRLTLPLKYFCTVRELCEAGVPHPSMDGIPIKMQVDTGSPVSRPTFTKYRYKLPALRKTTLRLSCFLGKLPVKGQLLLLVMYAGKTASMPNGARVYFVWQRRHQRVSS